MLDVKNLVVISEKTDKYLGYIFFFSIGSQKVDAEDLRKKLLNSGLEEEWMPRPIRSVDAFRRATKSVEKKRSTDNPKIFENILVREVFVGEKSIQRNIVIEQVNQNNKKLGYETEVAIIELDKKTGALYFQAEDPDIVELCNEIKNNYHINKKYYDSQHVRVMVSRILNSLAPIPLRENGVIYFVPQSMEERVNKLVNFIRELESSDAYAMPVVNTSESKYMINKRLNEHFNSLIMIYENSDVLRKDQLKIIVEQTNQAIRDFNEYKNLVESEKENYKRKIKMLRDKADQAMREYVFNEDHSQIRLRV